MNEQEPYGGLEMQCRKCGNIIVIDRSTWVEPAGSPPHATPTQTYRDRQRFVPTAVDAWMTKHEAAH
jgi:hypothetical protein